MGLFFRRSARLGPFRLNFSKSGIGASVGVKGARVTMTPRGTTYVTVGSHGFYYRETVSNRSGTPARPLAQGYVPPPPPASGTDAIPTASASELVESSSERLIQQLNERARMSNPAWLLYVAAVAIAVVGLSAFPSPPPAPSLPSLPDVTSPFSSERAASTVDEYSALTARYGEPDSILIGADGPVPIGTAHYNAVKVDVVFVPVGCISAYQEVVKRFEERFRYTGGKGKKGPIKPCVGRPNAGWVTIKYLNAAENFDVSADFARSRLDKITARRASPPTVEIRGTEAIRSKLRAGMQSDSTSRAAFAAIKHDFEQRVRAAEVEEREVLYEEVALALGALGIFVGGIQVHRKNTELRLTRLVYELGESETQRFSIVQQSMAHLAKSHRVWRVVGNSSTSDWKRNAGATSLVRREAISVCRASPPRVETNCSLPTLDMGHMKLFFLPDVILCWQSGTFGSIAYQDFRVAPSVTRFIEDGLVPADATVVDRTWRYVNKSGGPDRRFNNNAQLPIAQYGVLTLTSSRGLNIHLNTSSAQASLAAANCWRNLYGRAERAQQQPPPQQPPPRQYPPPADHFKTETPSGPRAEAFNMLGLKADASASDVSAAYRRLAQQYHPDKVAGLAPEFQTLADKRMKEINAAYELLKGRGSPSPTA